MDKEQKFVNVDAEYLQEIEQKAKESTYYRGRVEGLEYVLDCLVEMFKQKED